MDRSLQSDGGDSDSGEARHRRVSDGASEHGSSSAGKVTSRKRRRVTVVGLLLVAVAVAFVCWLAFEGFQAKSSLENARGRVHNAKEALLQGDVENAAKQVDEAHSFAERAQDATHSLPWNIASVVPWLGGPFKTGQQVSHVVLGVITDVLQPGVNVGQALSPDRLYEGGRIDVQLLRDAAPRLDEVAAAAAKLDAEAGAIADPHYLAVMRGARAEVQGQLTDLAGLLRNASLAAHLAPSMMGADGPRTYFMGFQTNAEARGTGGLLGGFGILQFDNGTPRVNTLGQNVELAGASAPIDLGTEYAERYGDSQPTTDFRTSNQSSHFPYAAQIWKSMWEQQSGTKVDGAIVIDPVALSYVLGAVGPVTMPDGEVLTKDNVVELTESTTYMRFPTDQAARKQYLQDVASAVVQKMTGPVESPRNLLDAVGKAVGQGRIAVWSASPDDQKLLEETPLAHVVPDDPAPYAAVVINNLGGNKLDYYLRREIAYSAGECDGPTRKSSVTVRLTNTAPADGLPDYVAASPNLPTLDVPLGTNLTEVSLLATTNAQLTNATLDGTPVTIMGEAERAHPVFSAQLAIQPGQTTELRFELTEPTSPGTPRVPIQPLLDNITPAVSVPTCSK
jgi:Protein of unknown function (DUF4012)